MSGNHKGLPETLAEFTLAIILVATQLPASVRTSTTYYRQGTTKFEVNYLEKLKKN